MAKLQLNRDGDLVRLMAQSHELGNHSFHDLEALFYVYSGSELESSDQEFYVALFGNDLWVLRPNEVEGLNELLFGSWYDALCDSNKCKSVAVPWTPPKWRKRFLGILPYDSPRSGRYPHSSLPTTDQLWVVRGQLQWRTLPRPEVHGGHS